jgi:hypothetical protein
LNLPRVSFSETTGRRPKARGALVDDADAMEVVDWI